MRDRYVTPALRLARGGALDVLQNMHPAAARRVDGGRGKPLDNIPMGIYS
jgi:hypothetical protein